METQNTTTSNGVNNSHTKDNAAKIVFGDPVLCAQFLKGYTDIPLFKEIKPEDIENVSSHFLPLFQESRDSDTVNKIRIGDSEIYLIALIEHQSENDFDMSFAANAAKISSIKILCFKFCLKDLKNSFQT